MSKSRFSEERTEVTRNVPVGMIAMVLLFGMILVLVGNGLRRVGQLIKGGKP